MKYIIILLMIIVVAILYACCVSASRLSRAEEKYYDKNPKK